LLRVLEPPTAAVVPRVDRSNDLLLVMTADCGELKSRRFPCAICRLRLRLRTCGELVWSLTDWALVTRPRDARFLSTELLAKDWRGVSTERAEGDAKSGREDCAARF
jgi:hypothetical protein